MVADIAMVNFDWTINIGNLLTIIVICGAGLKALMALNKRLALVDRDILEINKVLANFSSVLTTLAVQKIEMENVKQDICRIDRTIEDLRRGEGMILPLFRGPAHG